MRTSHHILVTLGDEPPLPVSSGVVLHLDSSDASTMWADTSATTIATVGGNVARWDDKSGNGNHATQSSAVAQPVRRASSVEFVDSGDNVTFPDLGVVNHSVYMVLVAKNEGSFRNFFLQNQSSDRNPMFYMHDTGGVISASWRMNPMPERTNNHTVGYNAVALVEAYRTGVSGTSFANGADEKSVIVDPLSESTEDGSIGNGKVEIKEIVVANREFNAGEKASMRSFLMAKWGIS